MATHALAPTGSIAARLSRLGLGYQLGFLFGVVMPLVSAIVFPTWVHLMPEDWQERARLLELQFVAAEILVIAVACAFKVDFDRLRRSLPRDIQVALAMMLGAMFFSSTVLAKVPIETLLQSLITVVHLYFGLAVYYLARVCPMRDWDRLLYWLALGLVPFAVLTLVKFSFPPSPDQVPGGRIEWSFALPGYISVRYLGTWVGAIAAGLAIKIMYRANNPQIDLWQLFYVLAAAMTVWSGTRAAVFGIVGSVVVLALLRPGFPNWRTIVRMALLTSVAVALAVAFRFDDPAFWLFTHGDAASVDSLTSGRTVLWAATIDRWLDSPLFGWGTGSVWFEVYVGWTHTQPHNALLQFLFSWGLVGCLGTVWMIGRAVFAAYRSAMHDRARWPVLGLVFALIWMSMLDGAFYYPRFVIMIVAGLALLLAAGDKRLESSSG